MKKIRKIGLTILLLSTAISVCSCTVDDKTEDEYQEKYETLVSELQSGYQEYADQTVVTAMAKKIYTAMASQLTNMAINDITVTNDLTFESIKDELKNEGYIDDEIYLAEDLKVEWEINKDTYSVKTVTVTYNGITATYPEN